MNKFAIQRFRSTLAKGFSVVRESDLKNLEDTALRLADAKRRQDGHTKRAVTAVMELQKKE